MGLVDITRLIKKLILIDTFHKIRAADFKVITPKVVRLKKPLKPKTPISNSRKPKVSLSRRP